MEQKIENEIIKEELEVKEKFFLTPNYIRIILTGSRMKEFTPVKVGANNKILVPTDDGTLVRRTYTLRALDLESMEMTLDFVAHGKTGPASKWAIDVLPGQKLTVMMKRKTKDLVPEAEWYLIAGDHTALPVIAAILEGMGSNAEGMVYIEVYEEADMQDLKKPSGIEIRWLFNSAPGQSEQLKDCVIKSFFPDTKSIFVFAAAEYKISSDINSFLKNEKMLDNSQYRTFAYWKLGKAENDFVNIFS
jgi:NADPH-dependent ferric siderophore reductase